LRVSVDYRLEDQFVDHGIPYTVVAPGILSDDGYFSDATDIEAFLVAWATSRPDPDSIVGCVSPLGDEDGANRFSVWATDGKNSSGFDSPVIEWHAEFARDPETGEWTASEFRRVD